MLFLPTSGTIPSVSRLILLYVAVTVGMLTILANPVRRFDLKYYLVIVDKGESQRFYFGLGPSVVIGLRYKDDAPPGQITDPNAIPEPIIKTTAEYPELNDRDKTEWIDIGNVQTQEKVDVTSTAEKLKEGLKLKAMKDWKGDEFICISELAGVLQGLPLPGGSLVTMKKSTYSFQARRYDGSPVHKHFTNMYRQGLREVAG
ncbi:hypothetical protein F5878DRAFT_236229 [Lentinula raphanica]|uniref:Uncharacterized protein n=1 Tax=Lentinula raphanica TaxID=153919 RepID=A0AA38UD57_9AGAR|nr:hypothetical protein F5878DRAFT_236229 [Lentinula raphanica]